MLGSGRRAPGQEGTEGAAAGVLWGTTWTGRPGRGLAGLRHWLPPGGRPADEAGGTTGGERLGRSWEETGFGGLVASLSDVLGLSIWVFEKSAFSSNSSLALRGMGTGTGQV